MIFISAGTTLIPFDRLIESCLDTLDHFNEQIYFQNGATVISSTKSNIYNKPFISNTEMIQKIKDARLIICAAGEATVFQILQHSRHKPILFPRLKKYHEHVDDQQLVTARFFQKENRAFCAINSKELDTLIRMNRLSHKNDFLKKNDNLKIIDKLIEFTEVL